MSDLNQEEQLRKAKEGELLLGGEAGIVVWVIRDERLPFAISRYGSTNAAEMAMQFGAIFLGIKNLQQQYAAECGISTKQMSEMSIRAATEIERAADFATRTITKEER